MIYSQLKGIRRFIYYIVYSIIVKMLTSSVTPTHPNIYTFVFARTIYLFILSFKNFYLLSFLVINF